MYKNLFTRSLFTLVLCALVGFTSQSLSAQCNHTLNLMDSYGDGWNGNTIDVLVNGVVALDDVTLGTGLASGTETFLAADGDDITTIWNGGGTYGYEITYTISDFNGTQIGGVGDENTNIETGTAIGAGCPACTILSADITVSQDCIADDANFSVDVDLTDIGDATSVDITDGTTTLATVTATGLTTVGPFPNDTPVDIILVHNGDPLCNASATGLVNDLCPVIATLDSSAGPVSDSYCYDNNSVESFMYFSDNGDVVTITFDAGFVENTYDELIVWDSDGSEIYNGYGNAADISGLSFTSTGDNLRWGISSDNSVSCVAGSATQVGGIDFTVMVGAPAPPCETPMNIGHDVQAPTRAMITWDEVPGALRYDVHYRINQSGDAWTRSGALNNYKTLHFLAPDTYYDYIVRSTCDGAWDFAAASDIRRFRTPAGEEEAPARLTQEGFSIFPNPARESINVSYAVNSISDVNISVVDMTGRVLFNKQVSNVEGRQNETINVSEFGQGYYMLVIQSGEDKQVKKFATIR